MTDSQIDAPMSEQAMPVQIWADPPETFDGMDMWRSEPGGKSVRYIRATPTVLAADPAVMALVAEAVAEERERCVMAARLAMVNIPQADEFTCSICAAAIRGETP